MTKLDDMNGSYINQGLDYSTLDIPNAEPHGGLTGSNEFICKLIYKNYNYL